MTSDVALHLEFDTTQLEQDFHERVGWQQATQLRILIQRMTR